MFVFLNCIKMTKIGLLRVASMGLAILLWSAPSVFAQCRDNVVLVHGNAGAPSDWGNTYDELIEAGYSEDQIFVPSWGRRTCPACNDHRGREEQPVRDAIDLALEGSCTGQIDIIAHSMGTTLAAQQVLKLSVANEVDTFVGIGGAYRGLLSCGVYPFNTFTTTCGRYGLSVSSPFLDGLRNRVIANRIYSIKSWTDQVVCFTGRCLVYGRHSSRIDGEDESFTFSLGHFGLQQRTAGFQVDLIQ